jgi:hypothetical protein
MNPRLALKVLDKVMKWDTERASKEFGWLSLMANFKYDSYRDYVAGARFIECLADWLQQFEQNEREVAYHFVRNKLVFIGVAEMQHLIERVYAKTVHPNIVTAVAERLAIPSWRIWTDARGQLTYDLLKRRSLFLALSDGARIDVFRRANAGRISNEQVILAMQINKTKWDSSLVKLRSELRDPEATFQNVYLLDDFVATGTTLLRKDNGVWEGKLQRFWDDIREVVATHFEPNWKLHVHHYVSTYKASEDIIKRNQEASAEKKSDQWFNNVHFSFGTVLPDSFPLIREQNEGFFKLVDKYYDPAIQTKHTELGGTDVRLGFGACALPLIIEHNAPNNSIALLWAETNGGEGIHAMRPLFRRRQRHT